MSKAEIRVTCLFSDGAEHVREVLIRSFRFYLQRELGQSTQNLSLMHISDKVPAAAGAEAQDAYKHRQS